MRVLAKKKDYYDTAGFIDQSVVFVRERKEVEINLGYAYSTPSYTGLLGFCGKFYPYIHHAIKWEAHPVTGVVPPDDHYYYYSVDAYKESKFWTERDFYDRRYGNSEKDYVNFFSHWTPSDKLFLELDAPYFKVNKFQRYSNNDRVLVKTNPSLVGMQFGKVMDAPTAFQTINFYLTNQLVKTKDPDEIEDKYRLLQHGFDAKYSFRHPTKLKDLK